MAEIDDRISINGEENEVFVVEVKSHLRENHFQ